MSVDDFFVIVIAGPTGVGKTKVAINIAKYFNLEIINADSRQLYKEISIGTAKPSAEQLLEVKHHFVNSHSINDIFTAGDFERESLSIIESQKLLKKKAVMVCGGTGMYINALLNGLDSLPNGDESIRAELHNNYIKNGIDFLQLKLKELDEAAFEKIEITNPQRLMRAIEVCLVSGKKYSELLSKSQKQRNFKVIKIALNLDRNILYNQINNRVDEMMANGLELEARNVFKYRNCYALKTVGFNEIFEYFDNKITKEKVVELIKQHTRNYAKRQITWFNKDKDYQWFNANDVEEIKKYIFNKF